jgi:hypothetical protein
MTVRVTALIAIVIALLGLGIYWLINRPTPEEAALKEFFAQFKQGHYTEAEDLTAGHDFYKAAADTTIRDTDGKQYLIGQYFPESAREILRFAVEVDVRSHLTRWRYLGKMNTQRLDDNTSVVTFRVDMTIRDFGTGNGFGAAYDGRVEGTAHMKQEEGKWVVEKFELNLFSDNGFKLSPYLNRAQIQY